MHAMTMESVQAGDLKARCLALLDEVARNRTEIIVTKHGRPVARVLPIDVAQPDAGSVTLLAADEEAYFSTPTRCSGGSQAPNSCAASRRRESPTLDGFW